MPLQFYLTPNPLTPNEDDYRAVSLNPESYTLEDVYDHMTRGGSTITKAEAMAGFEEVTRAILRLIEDGNTVITPLVNISSAVSGTFNGINDRYDSERHQVRISVNPGKRLREISDNVEIERVPYKERRPDPQQFHDHQSGKESEGVVTSGGAARLTGYRLKFDESDESQGIFFINQNDGSETRVDSAMLKNKPKELIFVNPELEAGTYRLEIRTILPRTSEVRSGSLPDEFTVS